MKKVGILAAFVLGVLTAGSAVAEAAQATILLKSGTRVSGDLIDMGASGFTVRVNGQEQQISTNDVAVIDFGGDASNLPGNELSRASGAPFVVMKSGEVVDGRLYDIGGAGPLRISVDTSSGRRDYSSNDVARIYFGGGVPGQSASSSTATSTSQSGMPGQAGGQTVTVPGNRQWTQTGIWVNSGDQLTFSTSGQVQLSAGGSDDASPAGSLTGRYAQRAPLPSVLAGALIGRIGNGQPFGIGTQTTPVPMPASGILFLGINDDVVTDNTGQFQVTIQGGRTAPARRR